MSERALAPLLDGGAGLYLWVLEQNLDARAFYEARGGRYVERVPVTAPAVPCCWDRRGRRLRRRVR